ncbi:MULTISPECIES: antiterminator Q family protein [Lelliottia]|uniref:Antitermination protein n=1 Tax=Lelliottia aquatilis TaxID=2080838 RepID=A0ABX5A2U1_9ENTR|nr:MULTISPECIES: antiterminator Q family protein [Lelliottia]POZ14100.1 antitermination protein [Lelliottia aquatilis]POZ24002.1 antitermination protein [Lelliottia aquatilis]POZ27596.1 antitermination protein [Lelliottia sp. 7254-16]POZ29865.1 antitermination protein [Lelliottia aquatilis]POZ35430.1 antitermination protein [Lelliottia aquatilis]
MRDMYEVLDRWGAWAAADSSGVDWQPIAAGFKGLLPHGKRSRLKCNDDDGIMIDSCVAQLRKYNLEVYEIVVAHFIFGLSLREIAKKRKCSDGTIRKRMQMAEGFVCGYLAMFHLQNYASA